MKILFLFYFCLSAQASTQVFGELPKQEWVQAFKEAFPNKFCEEAVSLKTCVGISAGDCLKKSEAFVTECAKGSRLPASIGLGLESQQLGINIGYCVAKKFEDFAKDSAICKK